MSQLEYLGSQSASTKSELVSLKSERSPQIALSPILTQSDDESVSELHMGSSFTL